jgi:hypothetical protein
MIPGFVGSNIQDWLNNGQLPKTVSQYGDTPEQIFVNYATLQMKYGDRMKELPLGAVAMHAFINKLEVGLTQLMAGARSFRLDTLRRSDVVALTEEAAKVSGISYVMDAYREDAERIIDA